MNQEFQSYKPKLIVDPHVSDYIWQKRSWKERLFSWPWNPWMDLKKVYKAQFYHLANGSIVCSPKSYELIMKGNL